jgi:hypothetical protein
LYSSVSPEAAALFLAVDPAAVFRAAVGAVIVAAAERAAVTAASVMLETLAAAAAAPLLAAAACAVALLLVSAAATGSGFGRGSAIASIENIAHNETRSGLFARRAALWWTCTCCSICVGTKASSVHSKSMRGNCSRKSATLKQCNHYI